MMHALAAAIGLTTIPCLKGLSSNGATAHVGPAGGGHVLINAM